MESNSEYKEACSESKKNLINSLYSAKLTKTRVYTCLFFISMSLHITNVSIVVLLISLNELFSKSFEEGVYLSFMNANITSFGVAMTLISVSIILSFMLMFKHISLSLDLYNLSRNPDSSYKDLVSKEFYESMSPTVLYVIKIANKLAP